MHPTPTDLTPAQSKRLLAARNVRAERGRYTHGPDDRSDRWYLVHEDDVLPSFTGPGFRTLADAADALLATERQTCTTLAEAGR